MTVELERTPSGQFPTGVSGNPAGRPPKGHALAERLREKLKDVHPAEQKRAAKEGRDPKAAQEAILDRLLERAHKGDLRAIELVFNRADGKMAVNAGAGKDAAQKPASAASDLDVVLGFAAKVARVRSKDLEPVTIETKRTVDDEGNEAYEIA